MSQKPHKHCKKSTARRPPQKSGTGKIILFNKPYGVLCQFSPDGSNPTLADFIDAPGFYVAGRLDKDSEGLLVLTDDGSLQHRITHPSLKNAKNLLGSGRGNHQ